MAKRFKDPSPFLITNVLAAAVTIVVVLILLLASYVFNQPMMSVWLIAIIAIIIFLVTFLLSRLLLHRYIISRIRLIYRNIYKTKGTPKLKNYSIKRSENLIENVEQEVETWATNQHKEIEELKSLEVYRRDFMGNVFHELKTPIFSIQGYLHTLIEGGLYDANINQKYLERAASNVDRLNHIVQDLDKLAQLESGAIEFEMKAFNLKDLATEVMDDFQWMAKEEEVNIRFKKESNKAFAVLGNKEMIRQVFTNLIANSIKYGKKGGTTKIGFYSMDNLVVTEVTDDGTGIKEQHLSHVFDRFYTADKSRSRSMGGTGLGLAIVKHIMEAHNRTVKVRSTLGEGSTFSFTLEKSAN